jgi:hypothetical protein
MSRGKVMHTVQSYDQTVPLAWLQAPGEHDRASLLEFARGTLFSLWASKHGGDREVHVSGIRSGFAKLGVPALHRVGLKLLALLREAEPISGGYWLPTPFRIVEIEGWPAFVGAVPEALGYLGNIKNEGLCRLLSADVAAKFPRQSIESWMGVPPRESASPVDLFFRNHLGKAVPTKAPTGLEYMSIVVRRPALGPRFAWEPRPMPVLSGHQIAICRQSHAGVYRYFSGDLRSGRVATEAAIDQSIPRLLFAVASRAGMPVVAKVRNGPDAIELTVEERLPVEEYRLALLLAMRITRNGSRRTYYLAPRLAPALVKRLIDLGCLVETYK